KNSSTHSAFITPRFLIAFGLLLVGALLAAFGLHSNSQKFASVPAAKGAGAGVPLSKTRGEPLPADLQVQTPANYTGPHHDSRPVKPLLSRPLRQLAKIAPPLVLRHEVREPARPKAPTDSAKGGFSQTLAGPVLSAPTPTGLNVEGVGVGFADFVPSGIPPDTNVRVGAKQYVTWNNTGF